ncbi:MAG: hypothetical protein DDT26_01353 [Dehalococcoidia bacterium]|nr:hypothetical protein [Chloroflexota bacterium]
MNTTSFTKPFLAILTPYFPEQKADAGSIGGIIQGIGDTSKINRSTDPHREASYFMPHLSNTGEISTATGEHQSGGNGLKVVSVRHL